VRVAEYGPHRRAELAALMERVWGERPPEAELEWLYERNPVRPASVLLAEDDGRVVGAVAMSFLRMSIGEAELVVGMPVGLATDPEHRGRGIFRGLQAANEERAREAGVRLLLIVPNASSARVLVGRLAWTPLHSLRVWARPRLLRGRPRRTRRVDRLPPLVTQCHKQRFHDDRVLRDPAYLDWRFVAAPRPYLLLDGGDRYAVCGRRGRVGVVAATCGDVLDDVAAVAGGNVLVAAPPPGDRRRYALAGYLPTPRTFTVLGKSLHPRQPLPARPHFELGDLDFF
jgi:GNAT superfamily N-acetyltransferase